MNNLNNLSDEELDKLFRQSAEESDIEFDEGAWQKMNSLLDEKQPLRTNWRKYSLIILAILFLGSTAVYFGNENGLFNSFQNEKNTIVNDDKNIENRTENNGESNAINSKNNDDSGSEIEKQGEILDDKKSKVTDNKTIDKSDNSNLEIDKSGNSPENIETPISRKDKINIADNSAKTINISEKNKISNKTEKAGEIENGNLITSSNQPNDVSTNINNTKNTKKPALKANEKIVENQELKNGNLADKKEGLLESKNSEITKNDKNLKSKSKTNKPQNTKNNSVFANNDGLQNNISTKSKTENKNINITDNQSITASNDDVETVIEKTYFQNINLNYLFSKTGYYYQKPKFEVEVSPLELDLPEPKKVEFYKKGLAIRLAVSPDISTVSSNKISKIGSNIGGLLEYRFGNKLSVQAGVFRSMKYYDAMPDQYTWVWGYSHDKLVNINAQCKMMDYPINIRYDFFAKGTTRIFVGAGSTTYKMMNEKYHYNYVDNYSPTIKHRDWSGKTGTYLTSNLNLSIGLEKYISKNFTIQVEPFAKSPLKSIGFGKVPLITYGMMISGKYPLNNLIKK